VLCAGCSMERLEEVLIDMGESIESEEDVVPLDVAELTALELDHLAVRSPEVKGALTKGFPLLLNTMCSWRTCHAFAGAPADLIESCVTDAADCVQTRMQTQCLGRQW
jgi:hypothetical protein